MVLIPSGLPLPPPHAVELSGARICKCIRRAVRAHRHPHCSLSQLSLSLSRLSLAALSKLSHSTLYTYLSLMFQITHLI